MKFLSKRQVIFLLAAVLITLLSVPATILILQKADLPFNVYSSENSLLVKSIYNTNSNLNVNDRIISIDGIPLSAREEIEVIMDSKDIGQIINLKVQTGNNLRDVEIKATNFYTGGFVIFQSFTVLIFILLGVFVLLKKPGNKAAEIFYLSMIGAAAIMIITWGKFTSNFDFGYIARILFQITYIFTPVLFVHFSLTFPVDKTGRYKWFLAGIYLTGFMLLIIGVINFYNLTAEFSSGNVRSYIKGYNFCRYFMAVCVLISITIFLLGFINSKDLVERKKLKWLITGFIVGPLAFTLLWVLPQAFTDYAFIPEELVYLLMLAVPVTFTISIVKYHWLDIDFIINRSIIYSILVAGIFICYFAVVLAFTLLFGNIDITLISSFSAVFVAFLFNPLRNYVHNFVDKKFFKVQYNYREAIKLFFSEMKEINDIKTLSENVISGILKLIPAEKSALADTFDINEPMVLAGTNFNNSDFDFLKDQVFTNHNLLKSIVLPEKVEPGIDSFEKEQLLKKIKVSLILTSSRVNDKIYLILIMGNKKSGDRYSAEDLDLLHNILYTAASVAARIKLQQDLIIKDLEAKKLEELNKQKSLFVSSVSHELKTPLTSIRMYSELIQMKESSEKDKINDYAEYIEGESERLTRLINNVLNFSRIEKGIKEYYKEPVDLHAILKKVLFIMEYQVKVQNFTLNSHFKEKDMVIYADADALIEVFINLISNGIKYSGESKILNVISSCEGEDFIVAFQDYGIGMTEDEQKNLFTPFYRSEHAVKMKIPGTGLGLSIIRHAADAHNIKIQIQSKLNEGTTVKLIIPKFQKALYEEHIVN